MMDTANDGLLSQPARFSGDGTVTVTTEEVAGLVAGIAQIGVACEALRRAGRRASIAGNRITVDDQVYAQLVAAGAGMYGQTAATWMIHHVAGIPPAWIVGTEPLVSLVQ